MIVMLLLALLLIIFACGQGYIVNISSKTNCSEGRDLYISKCGGCHQLYNPKDYTNNEWDKILLSMQKKSKINDHQKNEIFNWIMETIRTDEKLEVKK